MWQIRSILPLCCALLWSWPALADKAGGEVATLNLEASNSAACPDDNDDISSMLAIQKEGQFSEAKKHRRRRTSRRRTKAKNKQKKRGKGKGKGKGGRRRRRRGTEKGTRRRRNSSSLLDAYEYLLFFAIDNSPPNEKVDTAELTTFLSKPHCAHCVKRLLDSIPPNPHMPSTMQQLVVALLPHGEASVDEFVQNTRKLVDAYGPESKLGLLALVRRHEKDKSRTLMQKRASHRQGTLIEDLDKATGAKSCI